MKTIWSEIQASGFVALSWFLPTPEDFLPEWEDKIATVVLIGNAGPGMWQRFISDREPDKDLLDDWTRDKASSLARGLGARAVFPFDRPYLPFQRWAAKGGNAFSSPLGLTIHPLYGLWHAYRAALLFSRPLSLPEPVRQDHPCESCPTRPCLSACPVGAFTGTDYDVEGCARHVTGPQGQRCYGGCLARRACPVGRDFTYAPSQARFHMRHFIQARDPNWEMTSDGLEA
ncbi:hypothetical protein FHS85_003947 [Rhodoligotrophos appendicifer]|uniref:hypothetical protein n=1 Tax=Rhodoligotrophos appendicifer TaxID=987056 RepID=UPI0011862679|nr:hypothetical protein [Rhodoligotrophos appendicifer]